MNKSDEPLLEMTDICKTFGGVKALQSVALTAWARPL